jgi:hypothetical protein
MSTVLIYQHDRLIATLPPSTLEYLGTAKVMQADLGTVETPVYIPPVYQPETVQLLVNSLRSIVDHPFVIPAERAKYVPSWTAPSWWSLPPLLQGWVLLDLANLATYLNSPHIAHLAMHSAGAWLDLYKDDPSCINHLRIPPPPVPEKQIS